MIDSTVNLITHIAAILGVTVSIIGIMFSIRRNLDARHHELMENLETVTRRLHESRNNAMTWKVIGQNYASLQTGLAEPEPAFPIDEPIEFDGDYDKLKKDWDFRIKCLLQTAQYPHKEHQEPNPLNLPLSTSGGSGNSDEKPQVAQGSKDRLIHILRQQRNHILGILEDRQQFSISGAPLSQESRQDLLEIIRDLEQQIDRISRSDDSSV